MNGFPLTCLVDTNIPKTANLAVDPGGIPDDLVECVFACVEAIDHVRKFGNLILDAEGEIFAEYQKNLSMRGQPGVGDAFLKWVHDHQWSWPDGSRVKITKNGDSYDE
ncbi:MAG: hypothetical protein NTZ05_04970, partial [Chloroflexi bacterium]|nr:hypothetical protein [Chloroflexota bacterium]